MTLLARTLSSAQHTLQTAVYILPPSRLAGVLEQFGKYTDFWACAALSASGFYFGIRLLHNRVVYQTDPKDDKAIDQFRSELNRSPEEAKKKYAEYINGRKSPAKLQGSMQNLLEYEDTARLKEEANKIPTHRNWGPPAGLFFFGCFFAVCAYSLSPITMRDLFERI